MGGRADSGIDAVLILPGTVRVFVASEPVDLRKGFDRLASVVRGVQGRDPLSGHLFAFYNRRRDQMKVLFFDRTGYAMFHKRLSKGTFPLPPAARLVSGVAELEAPELLLILEGLDVREMRQRRRWRPDKRNKT